MKLYYDTIDHADSLNLFLSVEPTLSNLSEIIHIKIPLMSHIVDHHLKFINSRIRGQFTSLLKKVIDFSTYCNFIKKIDDDSSALYKDLEIKWFLDAIQFHQNYVKLLSLDQSSQTKLREEASTNKRYLVPLSPPPFAEKESNLTDEEQTLPEVAIIVPTYNRRMFIPWLLRYLRYQTYPQSKMKIIIVDDGDEYVGDLMPPEWSNLSYKRLDQHSVMGAKRQICNDLAVQTGAKYIISVDDDDYTPHVRVMSSVKKMEKHDGVFQIGGCSHLILFYLDSGDIYQCGPFVGVGVTRAQIMCKIPTYTNHATHGTFIYTRQYAIDHKYNPTEKRSIEKTFTKNYSKPMAQITSKNIIICVCHKHNTVNKHQLKSRRGYTKRTDSIQELIPDPEALAFYKSIQDF